VGFFFFWIEKGVRDGNFTTDGVRKLREVVKEKLMEFTDFCNDHAAVLDEGRDLVVVRDFSADGAEPVLLLALLLDPHEPGGAVVANLDVVV